MAFDVDQWNECYMLPLARSLEARKGIVCWYATIRQVGIIAVSGRSFVAHGARADRFEPFAVEYDGGRFPVSMAGRMGLYFTFTQNISALAALADTSLAGLDPGPYNPNDFWFNT